MMYLRPFAALCCAVTLTPGMTVANEVGDSRFSLGASSFGATAEYAYRFHSNFSVRGVAGGLVDVSPDIDLDEVPYEADFSPNGVGILLDWHTGLGGLRVSGGAAYSTSSFSGQAMATGDNPVTVGTTTFNSDETVHATVNFANEFAPIVTIGYDQKLGGTWVLSGEIGAVFNGGYEADVSVSGGTFDQDLPPLPQSVVASLPQSVLDSFPGGSLPPTLGGLVNSPLLPSVVASLPQSALDSFPAASLANDLLLEAAAIEDDYLNRIKVYPYISITIGAKF